MHHVPGLVEAHVNNMTEVWEVLQTGSNARAVSSTNANEHSSRSHWSASIFYCSPKPYLVGYLEKHYL